MDAIVPFHKSQDTLLHPGFNDQIQNKLFTEGITGRELRSGVKCISLLASLYNPIVNPAMVSTVRLVSVIMKNAQ